MKMSTPSSNINVALNVIGFMDNITYTTGAEKTNSVQNLL